MAEEVNLSTTERQLAEELLAIHTQTYGKGAGEARAHILDDLVICMLDDIELMPNEQFMVEAGKSDAVINIRMQYQQAIETTFRAAVERATGRRVVSFASNTKLDQPNYVIEAFRLAPKEEGSLEEPNG